jgi:WD40 repeat protein
VNQTHDVFLSHSSRDKVVVRELAERLRKDGLRVWLDDWEIQVGDSIPAKVEEGLDCSRILLLFMSANAFGSDWARLEGGTFRFRDPMNKDRRFIPIRLDDTPAPGSLAQFKYIDWREGRREAEYQSLLAACRPAVLELVAEAPDWRARAVSLGHTAVVRSVVMSPDGKRALSGAADKTLRLWDLESSRCLSVLEGHTAGVSSVAISPDSKRALSGAADKTLRLWDLESSRCLTVLEGHTEGISSVAMTADGKRALSGADDKTLRLWDLKSSRCLMVLEGHTAGVSSVAISHNGRFGVSGGNDNTLRLWSLDSGCCLMVLGGHFDTVTSVAISHDGIRALSAGGDNVLRLWDLESRRCIKALRGHTGTVRSAAISFDGKRALSSAGDKSLRLWDLESGRCLKVLEGHSDSVLSVAISTDGKRALSASHDKTLLVWNLESGRPLKRLEGHWDRVWSVAVSPDGKRALSASYDKTVRAWDLESSRCLNVLQSHMASVWSVAISPDGKHALSASHDQTVRVWDLESSRCLNVLRRQSDSVWSMAISPDGKRALWASPDNTMRLWDLESSHCLKVLEGHSDQVNSVAIGPDARHALSGSADNTVRLWNLESSRCLKVLEGHSDSVWSVAISTDGQRALSGAADKTVRAWDLESGRCLTVLEGHTAWVTAVAISTDGKRALSGSDDRTARVWDLESGRCLKILEGHSDSVRSVAISLDGARVFSAAENGVLRIWDAPSPPPSVPPAPSEIPYTNAKVLLVGDSGVGKTGLARYLAQGIKDTGEKPSTDGAWATQWRLPHAKQDHVDREIWLWDFAGQVDYRLVQQLYMDDTAVAVLVFNPQNENLFQGLGQWDRGIAKATQSKLCKVLVAGRVDRGGLVVSKETVKRFMIERGFLGELHLTSAATGQGCDELRDAIANSVDWESLAVTSSPGLFRRMKEEILRLRDNGLVLLRMAELKQRMELALKEERFDLAQLDTVVGLLAGPGIISRVGFGGFILLRPEVLSRYAAALVRKVRSHPEELGCIPEDALLKGDLDYQDFKRLPPDDEVVLLRHLHETLISRAWCLRQPCDTQGACAILTFPSYYRRERKEKPSHPSILVSYRFSGPVDEIYATLVVRLRHTAAFPKCELWKSAADFENHAGQKLGILLSDEGEGSYRLDAHFEPDVDESTRLLFLRYVHDHLRAHDPNLVRLRHYFCPNKKCDARNQPFGDQSKIDKALAPGGKGKVFCPDCGKPIPLRDLTETKFDSAEVKEATRRQADESQFKIDNESRELILIGHAYAIAGEAGQIFRGYTNSDHGIDGEIEFKDDQGRASGRRLYLQLKSGDSYLSNRKRDDAEIFQIKNPRWADYWQQHAYPVMLVIRTSNGDIRWMDVSDYLKREAAAKQVVFEGERFDALNVRRLRDKMLPGG